MGIQAMLNSEVFRGEEDINRSKVVFTSHALKRFFQRFREQKQVRPSDFLKVSDWLRELLLKADFKNAVSKAYRVQRIIEYKEELFFFRNYRWQFVIARCRIKPDRFVLKTVIWLDWREYSLCHQ